MDPKRQSSQPPLQQLPPREIPRSLIFIGAGIIGVIAIIAILGFSGIFHKNQFGAQIKITNFSRLFKNVPTQTRDSIFAALHNITLENSENIDPDKVKAEIRSGSVNNDYDRDINITFSSFIVDLPTLEQSYYVQFEWSTNKNTNDNIAGYPIVVSCLLPSQEKIYPNFVCSDEFTTPDNVAEFFQKYPGLRQLPIIVSEYSKDYSKYTQYNITYKANEDYTDFTITIDDYNGDNYNTAITQLKELQIDTSKAKITYNDLSADLDAPARAPND